MHCLWSLYKLFRSESDWNQLVRSKQVLDLQSRMPQEERTIRIVWHTTHPHKSLGWIQNKLYVIHSFSLSNIPMVAILASFFDGFPLRTQRFFLSLKRQLQVTGCASRSYIPCAAATKGTLSTTAEAKPSMIATKASTPPNQPLSWKAKSFNRPQDTAGRCQFCKVPLPKRRWQKTKMGSQQHEEWDSGERHMYIMYIEIEDFISGGRFDHTSLLWGIILASWRNVIWNDRTSWHLILAKLITIYQATTSASHDMYGDMAALVPT